MDIEMKEADGLEATRQIIAADPEAKVCIVTHYGRCRAACGSPERRRLRVRHERKSTSHPTTASLRRKS